MTRIIAFALGLAAAAPIVANAQATAPREPRSCQRLHEEISKCETGMRSCDQHVIARLQAQCQRDEKRLPQVLGPTMDLNQKVTAQMLREREIAIHSSKQYVIDTIMKMRTECGYDDFCFLGWFELGGFAPQETEEQMQIFAEDVMPVIARECGGKVELLARGLDLVA